MKQANIRRTLINLAVFSRKPFRPNLFKCSAPFKTFYTNLDLFLTLSPGARTYHALRAWLLSLPLELPGLLKMHSFKSPCHWALILEMLLHSWNHAKGLAHSTLATLFWRPFPPSFLMGWEYITHDCECNPPVLQFAHSRCLQTVFSPGSPL